jgi:hypothetical protein
MEESWIVRANACIPVQIFFNEDEWTYTVYWQDRIETFTDVDEMYQGVLSSFPNSACLKTRVATVFRNNGIEDYGQIQVCVSLSRTPTPSRIALFDVEVQVRIGGYETTRLSVRTAETTEWPLEAILCDPSCVLKPSSCIACEYHNYALNMGGNFQDMKCLFKDRDDVPHNACADTQSVYEVIRNAPNVRPFDTCSNFKPVSGAWRKRCYGQEKGCSRVKAHSKE